MVLSFNRLLVFFFLVIPASILSLGYATYYYNKVSVSNSIQLKHTEEVLDQADNLNSYAKNLHIESNAYIITNNTDFLTAYNDSKNRLPGKINNLKTLTADNSIQQLRIDSMASYIDSLIQYSDKCIALKKENKFDSTLMVMKIYRSGYFRSNITHFITAIKTEENRLLLLREQAYRNSISIFRNTFLAMMAGIIILLIAVFVFVRYNFNKQKSIEKNITRAKDTFSKFFNESPAAAIISRIDNGTIIDCNPAYLKLVHYNKEELLGKTPMELNIISVEERQFILNAVKADGVARGIELQVHDKYGHPVWTSLSMQTIMVDDIPCLLSVLVDTTAFKKNEENIIQNLEKEKELNELKSNFVTVASHEFRTPLSTILSSIYLLEKYTTTEQQKNRDTHITRIKSAVNTLTAILEEFLLLEKIEEQKITVNREMINIDEHISGLCDNVKNLLKQGQTITTNIIGDPRVNTDPVFLDHIITNLISNAIKYSPQDSAIHISCNTAPGKTTISVKDNGIGISGEDKKHLFERFYRASNTGSIQGTGLGLHIVKRYVDMLDGTIDINSELGKGTEVILEI